MTKQLPVDGKETLFDEHPIEVGGFVLRAREAVALGRPTLPGWSAALHLAGATQDSSPYWVGDLLAYAETREDWREKIEQAKAVTKLTLHTLQNVTTISRKVKGRARDLAPTISHASAVTKLPAEEQEAILEEARDKGWTARDLTLNLHRRRRRAIIEGQATLEGMYRVLYADPPWIYGNRPPSGSGAKEHYDGLTIEQLCALPVAAHAQPDSVLFMWVTAPMLYELPGPNQVIRAWGFTPKTGRVWDKVDHNFGNYFSVRHEHLIVATRGNCTPDRPTPMLDSVVIERQDGPHSAKPESFRRDIERLYDGPYLELFGRRRVDGWTVFGNDARLWAQDARDSDEAQAGRVSVV